MTSHDLFSGQMCDLLYSSYKDTNHIVLGLTLKPHFNLITVLQTLTPNSPILRLWVNMTLTYEFGGNTIKFIIESYSPGPQNLTLF